MTRIARSSRALFVVVFVLAGCDGQLKTGGSGGNGGNGSGGTGTGGCVRLACQQRPCPGAPKTSVSGTVTTPKGDLPLYNVIVYVPNAKLSDIPTGASCDRCDTPLSGDPL